MASFDFVLDGLAADITQDFADRALPAKVLVGEWETFKLDASPRIVLGLGDFAGSIGQSLASRHAPGLAIDTGNGTMARTLGASLQDVIVWVSATAPAGTTPDLVARRARRATWALAVATLGAMWRSHGGVFNWNRGRWLNEGRAISTYGAALTFVATFGLPIPDDPDDVIAIVQASAMTTIDVSGSDISAPTITVP